MFALSQNATCNIPQPHWFCPRFNQISQMVLRVSFQTMQRRVRLHCTHKPVCSTRVVETTRKTTMMCWAFPGKRRRAKSRKRIIRCVCCCSVTKLDSCFRARSHARDFCALTCSVFFTFTVHVYCFVHHFNLQTSNLQLAKKYHPDVNKDAGAQAKFQEVSEAYEVCEGMFVER